MNNIVILSRSDKTNSSCVSFPQRRVNQMGSFFCVVMSHTEEGLSKEPNRGVLASLK